MGGSAEPVRVVAVLLQRHAGDDDGRALRPELEFPVQIHRDGAEIHQNNFTLIGKAPATPTPTATNTPTPTNTPTNTPQTSDTTGRAERMAQRRKELGITE